MTTTKPAEAPPAKSWRLEQWFPELKPETQNLFKTYEALLQKYNRSLNLISSKTINFTDIIHFADSIIASNIIVASNPKINHIYDFGSGNGFPGIVLAAMHNNIKVTCVDNDEKKCEFLKTLVLEMKLSNVDVLCKPVESLEPNSVPFAVSRGFGNISKAILSARKAMKAGGVYYHLKAEQWGMEISEIPTQLCSVWSPSLLKEYKLPVGDFKFALVKTEKIS